MRLVPRMGKITVSLVLFLALYLIVVNAQDNALNIAGGMTPDLSSGATTFPFNFGSNWRLVPDAPAAGYGAVLALAEQDELGLERPVAALALTLVEAEHAIQVFESLAKFPFPVSEFDDEPQALELDARDAAQASGTTMLNNAASFMLVIQVEQNLFVLGQAVSAGADLDAQHEAINAIATSVEATLPVEPSATHAATIQQPTEPARSCPTVTRLRVLNAEDAGGGRDFNADGDQVILTMELGPISAEARVDPGRFNEFRFDRWGCGNLLANGNNLLSGRIAGRRLRVRNHVPGTSPCSS